MQSKITRWNWLLLGLVAAVAMGAGPRDYLSREAGWFGSQAGRRVVEGVIAHQNLNGGWSKGYDPIKPPRKKTGASGGTWDGQSTIDNHATYTEMRLLARAYSVTGDPAVREAFERGLGFLLKAQYANGGWPQRFPLKGNYGSHITLNDDAMVGVMRLMKEIAGGEGDFAFTRAPERQEAHESFERGVDCLLRMQVKVDGTLTAWAQQYDAKTLEPAKARAYELPGLTGDESAGVVMLLMDLDHPSAEVKRAIRAAVGWFERSKITGVRVVKAKDPSQPKGYNVLAVEDPTAPAVWARYYDLETNRPFFVGRDGVKKWSMNEIELERRAGYAWLRPWGQKVLDRYPRWSARHGD